MIPEHLPDWHAEANAELDTRGLRCPEPLLLLRNRMRTLEPGAQLYVVATDPASVRDFDQYSRFLGHEIRAREEASGEFRFLFRKKGGEGKAEAEAEGKPSNGRQDRQDREQQ